MIDFLIDNPRCNLFAGMGLGKTVTVLTVLDTLKLTAPDELPALIVAPLRVVKTVWAKECQEWPHLHDFKVVAVVGTAAERSAALAQQADAYAINYENLPWLRRALDDRREFWPFRTVVCDESTKLKGLRASLRKSAATGKTLPAIGGTQRARVVARPAYFSTDRWINLSGTPAPNGLADLYGPQWMIDYGSRLGGSYTSFTGRWFDVDPYSHRVTPREGAQGQITERLRDCTLSLKAEDYFRLDAPIVNVVNVPLPDAARKMYRAMERDMFLELEQEGVQVEAFTAAARTAKCLQLAAGAIYTDDKGSWTEVHRAKLDALEDIIEEAAGAPVLVAYHFKSDLARLTAAFPRGKALDKNPATIDAWNAGKIPILFAHPASAGHGLNLARGGNTLVFFSLNWNLEEHEQIIERIGPVRQAQAGLNRNVFIHYLLAENTLDFEVKERLVNKSSVQDALRNALRRRDNEFMSVPRVSEGAWKQGKPTVP
jgi:SNF2 family DNA or RNA helicase